RVRLPGQPFCILSMLLERPGEIVTREEMRQRLWASDTFVDFEHSLNSAIKKLRAALGDSSENSRYVEPIPRLGYRFIAPTENVASGAEDGSVLTASAARLEQLGEANKPSVARAGTSRMPGWQVVSILTCLLFACVATYGFFSTVPEPRVTAFLPGTFSERQDGFAPLMSDGVRVFFLERHGDHDNLVQTSIAGGEAHVVDAPFPGTRIFGV